MFARQIAVMKGQAWNVVETLKQSDHGPLELTRRTRVCVWDDLVDVPVAIPLRIPSSDAQRRVRNYDDEEEMDIGATVSSKPRPDSDPFGLSSSFNDLPHPGKFELSRGRNSGEMNRLRASAGSPLSLPEQEIERGSLDGISHMRDLHRGLASSGPTNGAAAHSGHYKQSSGSSGRGTVWDGDDLEGDLGYAAAQDMEGSQRKVIVERLEAVKSKNPVFTWC